MRHLSFSTALTFPTPLFLRTELSHLSFQSLTLTPKPSIIRMGGGPRTFPGGVSKWQWKRMQAKKAKQLLKARLCRERQVYEMRKRAELKAAVSDLERPWEVVEKAPTLFSVSADEQVKVLADRFQRPGGFDLWTERDGPQLFHTVDDLPSARFFPKGVVHSVRPYKRISGSEEMKGFEEKDGSFGGVEDLVNGLKSKGKMGNGFRSKRESGDGFKSKGELGGGLLDIEGMDEEGLSLRHSVESSSVKGRDGKKFNGRVGKRGNRRKSESLSSGVDNGQVGNDRKSRGQSPVMRGGENQENRRGNVSHRPYRRGSGLQSDVFDMSLQQDGSYELQV